MKKICLLAVFLFFVNVLNAADVVVKIKGLSDSKVHLNVRGVDGSEIETKILDCKDGQFTFINTYTEPVHIEMVPESGKIDTKQVRGVVDRQTMTITLYLMPEEGCQVNGDCDKLAIIYKVEGSERNAVIADMRSDHMEMLQCYDKESELFRDNKSKEERDEVYMRGEKLGVDLMKEKITYIEQNPGKDLSGLFLTELNIAMTRVLYGKLTPEVINGTFKVPIAGKKKILDLQNKEAALRVGTMAPDFTLKGLGGKEITLSDLRGKYVFLYFWGSWCRWCLQGAPSLIKLQAKYADKVQFVGIVSRDTEATLIKCNEDNKITWESYFEKDAKTGASTSFNYGVTGFPKKVLIDPDGKVIFIYSGAHEEFYGKFDDVMKGK